MLYTTRNIYTLPIMFFQKMKGMHFVLTAAHHILSVICTGNALIAGNMHFWACFAFLCEITTVFLNNVWLCKEITIGGAPVQSYVPTAYAVNGLFLWAGFLVFRLILFPR